jgi:hypothetical protein
VFEVVSSIMDEAEHNEGAKIGAMMVMERFAELGVFKERECNKFIDIYLVEI